MLKQVYSIHKHVALYYVELDKGVFTLSIFNQKLIKNKEISIQKCETN